MSNNDQSNHIVRQNYDDDSIHSNFGDSRSHSINVASSTATSSKNDDDDNIPPAGGDTPTSDFLTTTRSINNQHDYYHDLNVPAPSTTNNLLSSSFAPTTTNNIFLPADAVSNPQEISSGQTLPTSIVSHLNNSYLLDLLNNNRNFNNTNASIINHYSRIQSLINHNNNISGVGALSRNINNNYPALSTNNLGSPPSAAANNNVNSTNINSTSTSTSGSINDLLPYLVFNHPQERISRQTVPNDMLASHLQNSYLLNNNNTSNLNNTTASEANNDSLIQALISRIQNTAPTTNSQHLHTFINTPSINHNNTTASSTSNNDSLIQALIRRIQTTAPTINSQPPHTFINTPSINHNNTTASSTSNNDPLIQALISRIQNTAPTINPQPPHTFINTPSINRNLDNYSLTSTPSFRSHPPLNGTYTDPYSLMNSSLHLNIAARQKQAGLLQTLLNLRRGQDQSSLLNHTRLLDIPSQVTSSSQPLEQGITGGTDIDVRNREQQLNNLSHILSRYGVASVDTIPPRREDLSSINQLADENNNSSATKSSLITGDPTSTSATQSSSQPTNHTAALNHTVTVSSTTSSLNPDDNNKATSNSKKKKKSDTKKRSNPNRDDEEDDGHDDDDIDKPRHPLTAYNFFFSAERSRILDSITIGGKSVEDLMNADDNYSDNDCNDDPQKSIQTLDEEQKHLLEHLKNRREVKANQNHQKVHGMISFKDLAKLIARRWRSLPPHKKQIYIDLAAVEMANYNVEKAEYKKKKKRKKNSGNYI